MISLWVLREKIRGYYARYDAFIIPAVRFVLGFLTFHLLNANLGFMQRLDGTLVELVLSLICCLLPYGVMATVAGLLLLAHFSSVSLEMMLILLIFLIFVLVLYYGFQPGDSYLLILTPLFFYFRMPYAIPILVGLSGSLASAVPVCCGAALFYILQYVKQNVGTLSGEASLGLVERFSQVLRTLLGNRLMLVMVITCAVGVLVVYLIRRLPVDYSWIIAIVAGALAQLASVFVGDFVFDVTIQVGELLAGMILSVVLALVFHFFVFAVDYSRTEYVQFEDDDYYYYVRAVPKISVSATDIKIQKIGTRRSRTENTED